MVQGLLHILRIMLEYLCPSCALCRVWGLVSYRWSQRSQAPCNCPCRALLHRTQSRYRLVQGALRKIGLTKDTSQRFTVLDTMSTVLHPGRFTLLLGPPGAGKSTLLNALSGRLHNSRNADVSR